MSLVSDKGGLKNLGPKTRASVKRAHRKLSRISGKNLLFELLDELNEEMELKKRGEVTFDNSGGGK